MPTSLSVCVCMCVYVRVPHPQHLLGDIIDIGRSAVSRSSRILGTDWLGRQKTPPCQCILVPPPFGSPSPFRGASILCPTPFYPLMLPQWRREEREKGERTNENNSKLPEAKNMMGGWGGVGGGSTNGAPPVAAAKNGDDDNLMSTGNG
ncbi:hypothetical protein CH63R_03278 [Colletotrichum higginsianum IMI 349063]|uniref:Uncharacterized protein n=1 Tax=Colletotrichum higginsianum (strain IMI 349063) TaxID=759273 RepID=A0A1B7YRH5_COLHI|nr:hypothetical protein CH63R_03278 [Colletotrichum higginsianum IMI 349063]OBR14552.1 hypothetical protein CH63R_03278 [Colletotrichum higginsianum IMI 349063]